MPARKTIFCIALAFIALLSLGAYFAAKKDNGIDVLAIPAEKALQLQNARNVVILDVRTARSWWRSNAKIAAAVRADPGSLKEWEPKYDRDKTLILYCS